MLPSGMEKQVYQKTTSKFIPSVDKFLLKVFYERMHPVKNYMFNIQFNSENVFLSSCVDLEQHFNEFKLNIIDL